MFEEKDLEILLGYSIPIQEVDDDADQIDAVENDALKSYYMQIVIGSIGKKNFKSRYNVFIDRVKSLSLKDQIYLSNFIIEKIRVRYKFEFPIEYDILSQSDVNMVYEFLEFLEYDHESFFMRIWKLLKPKVDKLNIKTYCLRNANRIVKEIEDQIEAYDFNRMIIDFLGTNNKNNLIKWFLTKSENLYTLIKSNLMRKE